MSHSRRKILALGVLGVVVVASLTLLVSLFLPRGFTPLENVSLANRLQHQLGHFNLQVTILFALQTVSLKVIGASKTER